MPVALDDDGGTPLKKPVVLKILGHDVTVKTVKRTLFATPNIGEADSEKGEIRLVEGLERSVYEATLLHEVLHIIDHHLDLDVTEAQITGLAQGLFQVWKDNPGFLK